MLLCRDFLPLGVRSSWVWLRLFLCLARLCGVALWMSRQMTPYTEVLLSCWNLHVRRRLWSQDLQVMAVVVEIPISLHNEQESKLIFSFLGGVLAWTARAATIGCSEGSTSPMSCLTQRRVQGASGVLSVCCYLYQQQRHQDTVEPSGRLRLLMIVCCCSTTTTSSLICG